MGIKKVPSEGGSMSLTPLPPPPPEEKYIFFALPSMNGPLPAELKFRENTDIKLEIDIVEKLLFAMK